MNKGNDKLINKIFLIAFPVIFIIMLAVVLITILKPFDYKKISQIGKTNVEECLKENYNAAKKQNKYYVLIYNKNDLDNSLIEETVLKYANYAKKNKDVNEIFILEVTEENLSSVTGIVSSVKSLDDAPYMFVVNEESVSTKYSTVSKICSALDDAIVAGEKAKNEEGHNH